MVWSRSFDGSRAAPLIRPWSQPLSPCAFWDACAEASHNGRHWPGTVVPVNGSVAWAFAISRRQGRRNCSAGSATPCRSNPVSGRSLRKTGMFQILARDYRLFRAGKGQIRYLETDNQFAKARQWRAFLRFLRVKSPGAGMAGWRRSADHTRLHWNSLLTGNFTGNFAILRL